MKERIRTAYRFTRQATLVQIEDISMTRLGQMLVDRGMRTGIEQGIQMLIQTCKDLCVSREDTEARILQSFKNDEDTALEYLKKIGD